MPPAVIAVAGAVKGAVAAAGVMKSLAVAGTAMSAVGALTKNEKLMKVGAVVGTIGSLGTMGAFGAGAKTLGMSQAAKSAATAAATTAAKGAATAYAAPAGQTLTRQAMQGRGPLNAAAGGYQSAAQSGGGLLRSQIATQATSGLMPPAPPPSLFQKGVTAVGSALRTGAGLVRDNPEVAQILATGGVELSNYLSGKTDADIDLLKSQIRSSDANAQQTLQAIDDEKRRRQNLNQGYLSVNTSLKPIGLLSQNMPGVPA